jgi:hypothetical protein
MSKDDRLCRYERCGLPIRKLSGVLIGQYAYHWGCTERICQEESIPFHCDDVVNFKKDSNNMKIAANRSFLGMRRKYPGPMDAGIKYTER